MRRTIEFLLLLLAPLATAQEAAPAALRGPVTVTADRAEWHPGGTMLYTGNVRLVAADLVLAGQRMEMKQLAGGGFEARVTGTPATLRHGAAQQGPPLAAQARELFYDSPAATVHMSGATSVERGADRLTGETVLYDIGARRVQALGGEGGQVRIVIQPSEQRSRQGESAR